MSKLLLVFSILLLLADSVLAEDRLTPANPSQVMVSGEIGRRIEMTVQNHLLKLNVEEDFLQPFRVKKGIAKSTHQDRYVGLGKLIEATVNFAVHDQNPKVIALKDRLITQLIETQLADGYMGIFESKYRISTLWDLHEMVYLIHGLVADYEHFGNQASLNAAQRLADYFMQHRKPVDEPRWVGKLDTERAFIALYRATGKKEYLDYGIASEDLRNWRRPVENHAYTFMNICLAQLDLYEFEPNDELLVQSHQVIDFLQKNDGLIVSGTCSWQESFQSDQVVSGNLGETCATAYLIRLLHRLICIEGKSTYGDMMERGIFNALFAAQLEEGRRLRYFTPLEGQRPVFQWDTYCCTRSF